ncbi:MAG: lipoate--protein ligase family protein [Firmicutes bacterium]|nr:lipoate--protein ligase family protein [Bacillota bacterium]
MDRWRLLDPGPMPAWQQMALDLAVMRARSAGRAPDTLRFMEFRPHAALVGYHQAVDLEVDRAACAERGVEVNRRVTGGGAIYMDARQLGWEISLSKADTRLPPDPNTVYRRLSAIVVRTLEHWGIPAQFRPLNDIEVGGRKISGTGGAEWGSAMIYQGTILVDFDIETMLHVLRLPIEKLTDKLVDSYRQRIVTMREILGYAPALDAVKAAMVSAVEEVLGVAVEPGSLTSYEEEEWGRVRDDFARPEWIDRRRAPAGQELVSAAYKAPGGLLRAHLVVDRKAGRIRRAFLTGDFFVYPERAVLDLEAALKEAPADPEALEAIVIAHYRQADAPRYLGVEPADWVSVLTRALGSQSDPKGALAG